MNLVQLDALRVQVIVDNVTDSLSSVPAHVTHEMDYLEEQGMEELSGECLCCGAHGLSLLLTVTKDGISRSMLFDSGPEGEVFRRNVDRLKIEPTIIEEMVLSHGHWDHAGGLLTVLDLIKAKNPQQKVVFHLNAEMFHQRALEFDGKIHPFKKIPSKEELKNRGAELMISAEARLLLDKMVYLSGEISRVTAYEKGFPGHVKQLANQKWVADPLILDERFLLVNVRNKGLIVFSACSHAGIINVLRQVRDLFPQIPLYAVMGGFHLSGDSLEKIIPNTVEDMQEFNLKMIIPAHCTGWRAVAALANAFGDEIVVPSAVGRLYQF